MPHKLGRIRPDHIVNTPKWQYQIRNGRVKAIPRLSASYDKTKDVSPPPNTDWSAKAATSLSRMYLNDKLGDCVIAGKAHAVGIWSGNETGTATVATDEEIERNYVSICGPGDQGCVITDVLDAMKAGKFVMSGKPALIDGYVAVDFTNQNLVMTALEVFGSLTIGVNLTDDCTTSGPGVVWKFAGQIVGGHDVTLYGADEKGVYVSTWGTTGTLIPWDVFTRNAGQDGPGVDECYVSLSPNWYAASNLAPNGIDAKGLQAALIAVQNGTVPPLPGPAPVTPPSPPVVPPVTPPTPQQGFSGTLVFADGLLTSTGPAPAPGRRAAPGFTFNGQIDPQQVTLPLPVGVLGTLENVTLTLPAISLSGSGTLPDSAPRLGSLDWATLLALVEQYGMVVLPIVLSDYAAGKTWSQIVADVAAALLTPAAGKRPCGG